MNNMDGKDIARFMRSPLVTRGGPENFLRLVLAQAGGFGVPPDVIATLDDLAAMLGYYDPLPKGPAEHLAGPFINWRAHPNQPTFERVQDVERLAFKQRALIAFGAGRPNETVGTAELCIAMGNLLKADEQVPMDYQEVFWWAALDVLPVITGRSVESLLRDPEKRHWKIIPDRDVLTPGGRLYGTYVDLATSIRRTVVDGLERGTSPRANLLPFARQFLAHNEEMRAKAVAEGNLTMLDFLDKSDTAMRTMFPNLLEAVEPALAL